MPLKRTNERTNTNDDDYDQLVSNNNELKNFMFDKRLEMNIEQKNPSNVECVCKSIMINAGGDEKRRQIDSFA